MVHVNASLDRSEYGYNEMLTVLTSQVLCISGREVLPECMEMMASLLALVLMKMWSLSLVWVIADLMRV